MWSRQDLKQKAKLAFKANYWGCVVAGIVLMMCTYGAGGGNGRAAGKQVAKGNISDISSFITPVVIVAIIAAIAFIAIISVVVNIFLLSPLSIGCQRYFIETEGGKPEFGELVYGFKNNYGKNVLTMFLKGLFTSLWTLLFIIPGIIKSYEYRMIPFILADQPEKTREEAFLLSKEMMLGNKWNTFVLDLSFIGWAILSFITCGVVQVFYVGPYIYMTNAELYLALKK